MASAICHVDQASQFTSHLQARVFIGQEVRIKARMQHLSAECRRVQLLDRAKAAAHFHPYLYVTLIEGPT